MAAAITTLAAAALVAAGIHAGGVAEAVENGSEDGRGEVASGTVPLVNGRPANEPVWALFLTSAQENCSAVVFDQFWALTARHCVDQWPSGTNLDPEGADLGAVWRGDGGSSSMPVIQAFWQEDHDLALLRLRDAFQAPIEGVFTPITNLPRLPVAPAPRERGAVLFGYGDTCEDCPGSHLPRAGGQHIQEADAWDAIGGPGLGHRPADVTVRYGDAEVRYPAGQAHKGDSGSGLIMDGVVVGVWSGWNGNGRSLSADVFAHRAWILEIMGF